MRTTLWIVAVLMATSFSGSALAEVSAHSVVGELSSVLIAAIDDDAEPWGSFSEDSGENVLNVLGNDNADGPPSIVIHPETRIPIAAWSRNTGTTREIVVSQFASGMWTLPVVVDGGATDRHAPALAVDAATGDVHMVFWTDEATPRVLHRVADAGATGWSAAVVVSQPAEAATRPHALVRNGQLLVTYESQTAGSAQRQIVLAENVDGSWLSETVASSNFDAPLEPEVHGIGNRIWVDWFDGVGIVRWTHRDDGFGWAPLGFEPFDGLVDRNYHVRGRVAKTARERN